MRIAVVDYSGHPFQVQLSRELARRGHVVLHLHFADFQTPKGRLTTSAADPPTLCIEAVSLGRTFTKYDLLRRRFQEVAIGKRFAARLDAFRPDVVVGSNLPLDSLRIVSRGCRRARRAFVFWQQDIYSVAIERFLVKKAGWAGRLLAAHYKAIERRVLRTSQATIVISDDFVDCLAREFAITDRSAIHVIENWAPLDEIAPRAKDNGWARAAGLSAAKVVMYSGTLGLKHDPELLLAVAEAIRDRADTELVVISEGPAAAWLAGEAESRKGLPLRVLPFQPFDVYADVLGAADVLIAILEPDSGVFSVPSKILSYLCARRAIVLSAPAENLASRIVNAARAGIAVPSASREEFVAAVCALLDDPEAAQAAGRSARAYAEVTFAIGDIADRFETVLQAAHGQLA